MRVFDNRKVKGSISILLASLSLGGVSGCKPKDKDEFLDEGIEINYEDDYEEKYNQAFEKIGVEIEEEVHSTEEPAIKSEAPKESIVKKDNDLAKVITGMTERERLVNVLEQKNWGQEEETLLLKMFDIVDRNYDLRDINKPQDKQMYLKNLVNTISQINEIRLDPDDPLLEQNGWKARADRYNNMIILAYDNLHDFLHEISHLQFGTFLVESVGVDLGYVFEEGRASTLESNAREDLAWLDDIPINVNKRYDRELIIENCGGSYPAFEEIYKNCIRLGLDMEKIRVEAQPVSAYTKQIENELNQKYGNQLGTEYITSLNAYIAFFDQHGLVNIAQNQLGQDVFEVRDDMLNAFDKLMLQSRANEVDRIVGMER